MTNINETNAALKEQFENEFRPLLMKKVYPEDNSGIKYMLTSDNDEAYVESKYADVLDEYRPYLIIAPSVREVMDNAQREEWRMEKEQKRHVSVYDLDESEEPSDEDMCPPELYETSEANKRLYAAIDKLEPIMRRRIVKYFFEGKDYREIAAEEHKSVSTIHESIQAAIKKLKKTF